MREKEKIQNEEKDIKKKALNTMKRVLKRIVIRVGLLVGVILLIAAFVLDIFEDKAKKASQFGEKINEAYTIEGNEIKVKDEAIDKIIADLETNESYERVANMTVNEVRTGRKNTLDTFYLCDKLPPETDSNKDEIQEMKRKYIRMFMQAELVTQELNRGGTEQPGKAYGRVYVKRTDDRDTSENGTNTKELTYKSLTEFQALIDSGNMDAEKYFSINESNQLLVSSWSKTTVNGVVTEFIMTARPIDYKALIQQYSVPYEFLIDLCMQTQSTQFMVDFVNRIFNSRIELTIQDIHTETTTVETITYDNQTETFKKSQIKTISSSGSVSYSPDNPEYPDSPTVTVTAATPEITTTLSESRTPSVKVTYAKTWFVEQTMNYTNTVTTTQNAEGNPNPGIDYPLDDEIGEWVESGPTSTVISTPDPLTGTGSTMIRYTWTKERKSKININQNIKQTTITNSYSPGIAVNPVSFEKEIIELLEKKYPIPSTSKYVYPGENLSGGAEMFFMLLQTSSRTQAQEQIMRFILYKYTGRDYGVTEFDFSIFDPKEFTSMSGSGAGNDLLVAYIHYFEHSTPPPTNADGTKYIIETDGNGHPTVGYGVDIFNGGFASLFEQSGYPTHVGGEVDKEFVDSLERQEIERNVASARALATGEALKEYQIHALVSRAYNCGESGAFNTLRGSPSLNFVNSYKSYWNSETDDQFESKNPNANFGHKLYTQYMAKPVTSDGRYLKGLETRRKSEWTLFQTGYYDVLDKWYQGLADYDVEAVESNGYNFPHYLQRNFPGAYGTSTIPKSGCGPTSLSMILAGLKNDPSINPQTVVANINAYWPNGSYYVPGVGSSHCIFSNAFLQKYYGVSSEVSYPSEAQAIQALAQGYPVIGGEKGHILAIIPPTAEDKAAGYKFRVMDSGRGHDGAFKSAADFVSRTGAAYLRFTAIIRP